MADRTIFICTLVFAALYFYATSLVPSPSTGDPVGPRAFPYLLGICLMIGAVLLLFEIRRSHKGTEPLQPAGARQRDWRHLIAIGSVVILTGVYFSLLEVSGYILSTIGYLILLMAYFNRGRWLMNVLTSVLFGIATYWLFQHVLGVSLPKGYLSY
jgi:putative tricarboxylic transport membrane protein